MKYTETFVLRTICTPRSTLSWLPAELTYWTLLASSTGKTHAPLDYYYLGPVYPVLPPFLMQEWHIPTTPWIRDE